LGQDLTPSSARRAAAGLRSTVTATVAAGASAASAPGASEPEELEAIERCREAKQSDDAGTTPFSLQCCDPIQFRLVYKVST
jgi:hypothetical protein